MSGRGMKWGAGAAVVAAAILLSACSKKEASLEADTLSTASISSSPVPQSGPSFRRTEQLAKAWETNPKDVRTGLAYATSLGELGQKETQLQVLRVVAEQNPANADVQSSIGKQLLAAGDADGANKALARAAQLNPQSWQTFSALGATYDQSGRHSDARENYTRALALKPGDLSVMNNMAMSHALEGQLPEAEKQLREIMTMPGAKAMPRIRQNLALVVGLQGRFEESEKIASTDLPPDQVAANLAYLKKMLAQPDTWSQLQDG
jgi:Flp pilus assembly protein TadD